MGAQRNVVIVLPCYNEEHRLRLDQLRMFERHPGIRLLFVNDGSTDSTPQLLRGFCARSEGRADLLSMAQNQGKAEAVRLGMNHALAQGATIVGYLDVDLSTPVEEAMRILGAMERTGVAVALGARVALLGASIERSRMRQYLGRVFATAASFVLGLRVYDTQCGAKFFRDTRALRGALEEPFSSRWVFDVELIGRLLAEGLPSGELLEVPLQRWNDVRGSKLKATWVVRSGVDFLVIAARLRRRARP